MTENNKWVQTLRGLGLTANQAKIFLALTQSETVTVRMVSYASKVAREEVYRILPELQKLGLIEKEISVPAKFNAIPIKEALKILFQQRTLETEKLKTEMGEMLYELKNSKKTISQKDETKFVLIPARDSFIRKSGRLLDNAQKSIEVLSTKERFLHGSFFFGEKTRRACLRGVKVRMIIDRPKDEKQQYKIINLHRKFSSGELKFITNPLSVATGVYDKKEVMITISPKLEIKDSSCLWSNSSALVKFVGNYFEVLWTEANEAVVKEHSFSNCEA